MGKTLQEQLVEKGFVSSARAASIKRSILADKRKAHQQKRMAADIVKFRTWKAVAWAGSSLPPNFDSICSKCGAKMNAERFPAPKPIKAILGTRFGREHAEKVQVCRACNRAELTAAPTKAR
jgi:hypothetical protein